jgi:hypothetical protein
MILDKQNQLSDSQAFTIDAVSTNTIDCGNPTPKNDIGSGEPMCIAVNVEVAATGGGAYEFQAIQSANADLSSPDVLASVFPAEATLAAGYTFAVPIPQGSVTKRYVGLKFNNVSGTTGVTVSAHLIPVSHFQNSKPYAKNYTITV